MAPHTLNPVFAHLDHDDPAAVEALLERDPALVETRDLQGCTPLLRAVERDLPRTIDLLLSRGADPGAADQHGVTPLHLAASAAVAQALLAAGADVHARDEALLTPLHDAILEDRREVVELLLDAGADLLAVDAKGYTPLRMARDYRLPELQALLEARGATF